MALIIRPITDDGLVGYDQFGQLVVTKKDGEFEMAVKLGELAKVARVELAKFE